MSDTTLVTRPIPSPAPVETKPALVEQPPAFALMAREETDLEEAQACAAWVASANIGGCLADSWQRS